MPDTRRHRGPHAHDAEWFGAEVERALRTAVSELSWLLGRGYAPDSALKLVGDRHALTARQRQALRRGACSDADRDARALRRLPVPPAVPRLAVDGYNVLITVESALSGALVLDCRDGACRDLASLHGTWRRVDETARAVSLVGAVCDAWGLGAACWYLDRPVSNSGRLAALLTRELASQRCLHTVSLSDNPDRELVALGLPVASSDSWVLDRAPAWVDLPGAVIDAHVPGAWRLALGA